MLLLVRDTVLASRTPGNQNAARIFPPWEGCAPGSLSASRGARSRGAQTFSAGNPVVLCWFNKQTRRSSSACRCKCRRVQLRHWVHAPRWRRENH
jgi:hypothetical protein